MDISLIKTKPKNSIRYAETEDRIAVGKYNRKLFNIEIDTKKMANIISSII